MTAAVVACAEPPSVRARWSLIDRDGEALAATSPLHCTSLGINTVRMRIFDELGFYIDDSFYACFANGFEDEDATVAGPALPPGRYAVEIRGVQRNNEPWMPGLEDADLDGDPDEPLAECSVDDPACDPRDIACDCDVLEAREDRTVRLTAFELAAPDECIDGIDNDADGVLDAQDPSCIPGIVPGVEGNPVSAVQFRVAVSLFGGNTAVDCAALGVTDLRARVCARDGDDPQAPCPDEGSLDTRLPCRTGDPSFFELVLAEGDYVLEMVAQGAADAPRTKVERFDVEVGEGAGAFVPVALDLGPADFDPQIVAPAGFGVRLADDGVPGGRGCASTGEVEMTELELELRDAHGGALAEPVLLAMNQTDARFEGLPLDGTPSPCPTAALTTVPQVWGGWSLRVVARNAAGTVCFSTDGTGPGGADAPLQLAPSSIAVVVPHVLDADGNPPEGCE
jgi:hypothetical protein